MNGDKITKNLINFVMDTGYLLFAKIRAVGSFVTAKIAEEVENTSNDLIQQEYAAQVGSTCYDPSLSCTKFI